MTIQEAIKIVRDKAALRTRYKGQPDFLDEVLLAEIDRQAALIQELTPNSMVLQHRRIV
jgi:hypothetical protein